MRLALLAMGFVFITASASAQAPSARAVPVLLASSDAAHARAPRAAARPFARVEVGIRPDWPSDQTDFADYAVQEIEAGSVDGDLYVRWGAFAPHASRFTVEVSLAGQAYTVAAVVTATDASEFGVHLLGVTPGLYEVRMREASAAGTEVVSMPVRVRV